jgi:hypothetical protein
VLATELVPRLRRTADAVKAPPFTVDVVASRDPLRVDAETSPDGAVRLSVSAGFLVFMDVLTDAEVLGRITSRQELTRAYADEVVRLAGLATRPEVSGTRLPRFHQWLGWPKSQYDQLFASDKYQMARTNIQIQGLSFLVAHRVLLAQAGGDPAGLHPDVERRAVEWLLRTDVAPFPTPSLAMLYVATLDPREQRPTEWRCRTATLLERNVDAVERAKEAGVSAPAGMDAAFLARWRDIARATAPEAGCKADTAPPRGARR